MSEILKCSPLQFKLKRKEEHIDDHPQRRLSQKSKKLQDGFGLKYTQSVAPGQEEECIAKFYGLQLKIRKMKKYIIFNTICICIQRVMLS